MNNRNLLIILLALFAIYAASQWLSGNRESSFETELIQVDTTIVSSVIINPKEGADELSLNREGAGWIVSNGTLSVPATNASVNSLLTNLTNIQTKRIAAKSSDKWSDYEVGANQGTRIRVYNDGKVLEDFIVGRFAFNQQARTATSFIRFTDQDEVYAVDGFLSMTFGQGFDAYRNKQFLKLPNAQDISEFVLENAASGITATLTKNGNQWLLNAETPVDSASVAGFSAQLQNVMGVGFADDFDELKAKSKLTQTVTIKGNNLVQPIQIQAFRDSTRTPAFVLKSNQNPAYFSSDSTGIYSKIIGGLQELIASKTE